MEVGRFRLPEICRVRIGILLRLRTRGDVLRGVWSLILCGVNMGRKAMLGILRVNLALTRRVLLLQVVSSQSLLLRHRLLGERLNGRRC